MKKLLAVFVISIFLSACLASSAFAQEKTITGEVICVGCTLKGEYGAKAQCSVYGHTHGLRTKDGKVYTFLENDKAEPLIKSHDYAHATVEIKGRILPKTQIIQVDSFKVLEKKGSATEKKGSGYEKKGS